MLRLAVLALLLANAGYYAWSQGLLGQFGLAPEEQSEPQRMNQQIRPETLQILRVTASKPAASVASAAAAPPAAAGSQPAAPSTEDGAAVATAADTAECLQAGVFDERQAEALRAAATVGLPADSWVMDPTPIPGRWMIYMGRYEDIETLDRKRAELRARKVDHDRAGGALEIGLSLGRFSTQEAAERELANLSTRGVRTARVIQERPDSPGFTLRLPSVNDALRAKLDGLRSAMAGKTLRTCA
jgi:hypothetical protein